MLSILLLAAIQSAEPAQPAVAQQVTTATISGRVMDAVTKQPVPGVTVRLLTINAVVVSDDEGRYAFADVYAGTHRFVVERPEYFLLAADGTPQSAGAALSVEVREGERLENFDFVIKRGASIH